MAMFENFGKSKEEKLQVDPETFKDIYESNLDSAFADNIRSIAHYLNEGEVASQMTQEGAEIDREYIDLLSAIRGYLESINLTVVDLAHTESLALNLIEEESKGGLSESFKAYLEMVKAGGSKLKGIN